MPRVVALVACLMTTACLFAPAAHAGLSAGGLSSDGVEWVRNIPLHFDAAGGRLHEGFFYITTERDLSIYDVAEPANPALVGRMLLPDFGEPTYTEEDPDTNGEILLVSNGGVTSVIDVREKAAPKLLSQLDDVDEHTLSCVLNCTWAYGSEGAIIDLRDPAAPKLAGKLDIPANAHDVTEVAPGLVLTASAPIMLLDARFSPTAPVVLARGATEAEAFIHAVRWPQLAQDDLILAGGEAFSPACADSPDARFMTWNTIGWQESKAFTPIAEYHVDTGTYADGRNVTQTWCTHWFMENPTYSNGGLVALAWYEHGVRFLKIAHEGSIEEVGWFLPHGGQTSAVYWITDRIMYTADYYRGLDVLEWTAPIPRGPSLEEDHNHRPEPSEAKAHEPPARAVSFAQVVKISRCVRRGRVTVRFRKARVRRATAWLDGRRVLRAKGRNLRALKLRRVPRRRQTLTVSVTTEDRRTLTGGRTIMPCT